VSKALRSLYDAGHFQQLSEVAAALDNDVGWLWLDILAARYSSEEMHRQYVNALFMGSDEEVDGRPAPVPTPAGGRDRLTGDVPRLGRSLTGV
jgi:hypothetical protein